ncbi:MAG: hypothetical protein RhofKO_01050 [Rhodothermales bacterium]
MKRFSALLCLLVLVAVPAQAQFLVGPHAGFNLDSDDLAIGASAQFDLAIGDYELVANPNVDLYLFEDTVNRTRLNLDVLYPFGLENFVPYVGAGLLVEFVTIDLPEGVAGDTDETNLGLNLKAGAVLELQDSPFMPFAELTAIVGGSLALRGGIMFSLGQ